LLLLFILCRQSNMKEQIVRLVFMMNAEKEKDLFEYC
jgi:hypothetical protein